MFAVSLTAFSLSLVKRENVTTVPPVTDVAVTESRQLNVDLGAAGPSPSPTHLVSLSRPVARD